GETALLTDHRAGGSQCLALCSSPAQCSAVPTLSPAPLTPGADRTTTDSAAAPQPEATAHAGGATVPASSPSTPSVGQARRRTRQPASAADTAGSPPPPSSTTPCRSLGHETPCSGEPTCTSRSAAPVTRPITGGDGRTRGRGPVELW